MCFVRSVRSPSVECALATMSTHFTFPLEDVVKKAMPEDDSYPFHCPTLSPADKGVWVVPACEDARLMRLRETPNQPPSPKGEDLQLVVQPAPWANLDMPIASGYVPFYEVIFVFAQFFAQFHKRSDWWELTQAMSRYLRGWLSPVKLRPPAAWGAGAAPRRFKEGQWYRSSMPAGGPTERAVSWVRCDQLFNKTGIVYTEVVLERVHIEKTDDPSVQRQILMPVLRRNVKGKTNRECDMLNPRDRKAIRNRKKATLYSATALAKNVQGIATLRSVYWPGENPLPPTDPRRTVYEDFHYTLENSVPLP